MFYLFKYRHGDKKNNLISLTFDDGPSSHTKDILNILDEFKIFATFFLIPENIKKLPDVAHEILSRGHEIGGHAAQPENFSFLRALMNKASEKKIKQSISITKEVLGVNIKLFRPSPELTLNTGTGKILKKLSLIPILASSYSTVRNPANIQFKKMTRKMKGGDIILMHDGHDTFINSPRPRTTIEILPKIINYAHGNNLKFVTVGELLEIKP